MAFKLTKAEASAWEKLTDVAQHRLEALNDAIEEFNADMEQIWTKVQDAKDEYNGVVADIKAFAEDIAATWRGEFDDKSEKWQEGDRGQAVSDIIDQWEGIALDESSVEMPDTVDREDDNVSELADMPTSVEESV